MTADPLADYGERLASRSPIVVQRRVLWGECDPAQVVYTPRFSDYVATAFTWFRREILDKSETPLSSLGLMMPMKALTLEFTQVLRPDDLFQMTVHVVNVSDRTFTAAILATSLEGRPLFRGTLTPICVTADRFESLSIPLAIRNVLEAYRSAYPIPDAARDNKPS